MQKSKTLGTRGRETRRSGLLASDVWCGPCLPLSLPLRSCLHSGLLEPTHSSPWLWSKGTVLKPTELSPCHESAHLLWCLLPPPSVLRTSNNTFPPLRWCDVLCSSRIDEYPRHPRDCTSPSFCTPRSFHPEDESPCGFKPQKSLLTVLALQRHQSVPEFKFLMDRCWHYPVKAPSPS